VKLKNWDDGVKYARDMAQRRVMTLTNSMTYDKDTQMIMSNAFGIMYNNELLQPLLSYCPLILLG